MDGKPELASLILKQVVHTEGQDATLPVILLRICSEVHLARLPAKALQEEKYRDDHKSGLVIGPIAQGNR